MLSILKTMKLRTLSLLATLGCLVWSGHDLVKVPPAERHSAFLGFACALFLAFGVREVRELIAAYRQEKGVRSKVVTRIYREGSIVEIVTRTPDDDDAS